MNKNLQGRFREVIHNNYTLYYFVYMYTQICDENAHIWGFPRRKFRPPPTWNFDDVNNQYSYSYITTLLPFFIEMLQYDWLWSGHMIIKEMFYIPIKLKPELARDSMTTSDVNNQWRSNFQQQII